jgi:hypothetical protein
MAQAGPEPIPARCAEKDFISTLPFIREGFRDASGKYHRRRFWHVASTGSPRNDHNLGVSYAAAALHCMRATGDTWLLAWIIRDMRLGRYRVFCPIAGGFLTSIAVMATAAAGGAK